METAIGLAILFCVGLVNTPNRSCNCGKIEQKVEVSSDTSFLMPVYIANNKCQFDATLKIVILQDEVMSNSIVEIDIVSNRVGLIQRQKYLNPDVIILTEKRKLKKQEELSLKISRQSQSAAIIQMTYNNNE